MNQHTKKALLLFLTIIAVSGVFFLHPIRQSLAYHDFADKRTFFNIRNFFNVVSNLPFLFVGTVGLLAIGRCSLATQELHIYFALYLGVFLTGLGSAYYHWLPNNNTLVWDRIPMTLVFMSLLSATVAAFINRHLGIIVFWPTMVLGIASVLWWHYGDLRGHGDLRLYGFVQFYPAVFIPLIVFLFQDRSRIATFRLLLWAIAWYAIAKLCEYADSTIYRLLGISGHTLKHVAAAISTWFLVKMFGERHST